MTERTWDLREVSRETFRDLTNEPDIIAQLGDNIDDEVDIAVSHYTLRDGTYIGTMRVTEDGTIFLIPDEVEEGEKMGLTELYDTLYGA